MTRPAPGEEKTEVRIGEWTVRPTLNRLDRNGETVDLEPKLMDLLVCLAERAGDVVSKEELLDTVWKIEHVSDGTLSHAIAELRRALGDDARRSRYIETIRKRGYRLVATVGSADHPGPAPDVHSSPHRRRMRVIFATGLAMMLVGAAWFVASLGSGGSSPPPKIIILPFVNLGDEAHSSFAAGLTDEIISRLAAVRGLQVVSRTTAFNYDSTGKSAREIGAELGVDYILEGAVRWGAEEEPPMVRITPQLIRVDEDGHLWSGRFDRRPEGVLDVQSEIARQIVAQLDLRLARDESEVVNTPPTADPAAYRAYLEALELRSSYDPNEIQTAAQMYSRAVEADPMFAQAWAGLAEASGAIHHFGCDLSPDACDTARFALERARELAPQAPDTMRASAYFEYQCMGNATAARPEFERALESWPGDALAVRGMAYACRRTGDWNEAEIWLRRALELDPQNPFVLLSLSENLISIRRYPEALTAVDRAIELGPNHRFAYFTKWELLVLGWGDTRAATEVLERTPGPRDAVWDEYAFFNACFAGDYPAASILARDSPPSAVRPLLRCLAATLTDAPAAAEICLEAADHYRVLLGREPEESRSRLLLSKSSSNRLMLARACSLAGLHKEAVAEAEAEVTARPWSYDAHGHAEAAQVLAQVLGRSGRTDEAVAIVEQLLETPSYLSPARLRIDPEWASLRDHPSIRKIIHEDTPERVDRHRAPADSGG